MSLLLETQGGFAKSVLWQREGPIQGSWLHGKGLPIDAHPGDLITLASVVRSNRHRQFLLMIGVDERDLWLSLK